MRSNFGFFLNSISLSASLEGPLARRQCLLIGQFYFGLVHNQSDLWEEWYLTEWLKKLINTWSS